MIMTREVPRRGMRESGILGFGIRIMERSGGALRSGKAASMRFEKRLRPVGISRYETHRVLSYEDHRRFDNRTELHLHEGAKRTLTEAADGALPGAAMQLLRERFVSKLQTVERLLQPTVQMHYASRLRPQRENARERALEIERGKTPGETAAKYGAVPRTGLRTVTIFAERGATAAEREAPRPPMVHVPKPEASETVLQRVEERVVERIESRQLHHAKSSETTELTQREELLRKERETVRMSERVYALVMKQWDRERRRKGHLYG